MILLVIDTQKLITNSELYNFEVFKENIKDLIKTARKKSIEIIYVRHDEGADGELSKGTEEFEIFEEFSPKENEKIFDKSFNSAFKETGLSEYLFEKREKTLMIAGLQTDYCIDATVKSGFERGFEIIVPADCNSTVDNDYMTAEESYKYYNEFVWKDRYAKCIDFQTAKAMIEAL